MGSDLLFTSEMFRANFSTSSPAFYVGLLVYGFFYLLSADCFASARFLK